MRCNILSLGLTVAVACAVAGGGCAPGPSATPKDTAAASKDKTEAVAAKHDHNAPGKHGGQQQLLGNHEYHAELTRNEDTGEVALYVTDAQLKPVVVPETEAFLTVIVDGQPKEFTLKSEAKPSGEPGARPHFVLVDKQLSEAIENAEGGVRLNVTIKGKPYAATYTKSGHAGHEHGDKHDEHSREKHADEHDTH
jgi:hypothetical protein